MSVLIEFLQIEAVATKGELEHLAFLCRSEVDSMGRITAGILRVLKLDRSIGQAAIDQLSNLGMAYNTLEVTKFFFISFSLFISKFQSNRCCIA